MNFFHTFCLRRSIAENLVVFNIFSGDQLGFEMADSGQITRSKNGDEAVPFMVADVIKTPLWFVLDVYGSTTTIHLMGKPNVDWICLQK